MAVRYSGDVMVAVFYIKTDAGAEQYRCSVTAIGFCKTVWIPPSQDVLPNGVAFESDVAFDRIAQAAIMVADPEGGELSPQCDYDHATDEVAISRTK